MRKYFAELIGTFVLTFFGCGAAAITGGIGGMLGILGIAMAFGLSIVAMAYAIGDVSGCHINPAVSIGFFCAGRMSGKDCILYIIFQCIGAILAAAALLLVILNTSLGYPGTVGLGANGYGDASQVGLSAAGAIFVEIVLTFVFVLVVLGVTGNSKTSHMGGLVIGLTLAFVHILGIPLTGTSVNPARSLGPALMLMQYDNGAAMNQLWVFIVSPIIGGIIAALVWRVLVKPSQSIADVDDDDVLIDEEYEVVVDDSSRAASDVAYDKANNVTYDKSEYTSRSSESAGKPSARVADDAEDDEPHHTAVGSSTKSASSNAPSAKADVSLHTAASADTTAGAKDKVVKMADVANGSGRKNSPADHVADDDKASGARKPTVRKHSSKPAGKEDASAATDVDMEADEIVKGIKASIEDDADGHSKDDSDK